MRFPVVSVGGMEIGAGRPCLIIAEAGVNHNGDAALAERLVDAAAEAGAGAVKFQTFKAERLAVPAAPKAAYQKSSTDAGETQFQMLKRLELSEEAHLKIKEHCRKRRILFLSSPFDELSADMLERLGVPAFKIPSGEITNIPFLEHVARKGRPLLISTGMSTLPEVGKAVEAARGAGNEQIVLLQCVSNYPADPSTVNLRAMKTMEDEFGVPVGYSDHTEGIEVALAAVALGACLVEKHFTLDRSFPGPDHKSSIEPFELARLVRGIRIVEKSLGTGLKMPAESETDTALAARKSLFAAVDIPAGAKLEKDMVAIMRPGGGLPPGALGSLIGRKVRVGLKQGSMLNMEVFE